MLVFSRKFTNPAFLTTKPNSPRPKIRTPLTLTQTFLEETFLEVVRPRPMGEVGLPRPMGGNPQELPLPAEYLLEAIGGNPVSNHFQLRSWIGSLEMLLVFLVLTLIMPTVRQVNLYRDLETVIEPKVERPLHHPLPPPPLPPRRMNCLWLGGKVN